MVFQNFNLFHIFGYEKYYRSSIHVAKKSKEALEIAKELLEKVGLSDKADAYPINYLVDNVNVLL